MLEDRKKYIPLYLSDEFAPFRGLHDLEWQHQNQEDLVANDVNAKDEQMARINQKENTQSIVDPAQQESKNARKGMTKAAQTGNIRQNRKNEVEHERRSNHTGSPSTNATRPSGAPQPRPGQTGQIETPHSIYTDLLMKIDAEEKNKKQ